MFGVPSSQRHPVFFRACDVSRFSLTGHRPTTLWKGAIHAAQPVDASGLTLCVAECELCEVLPTWQVLQELQCYYYWNKLKHIR
jgi:hypothetical protein